MNNVGVKQRVAVSKKEREDDVTLRALIYSDAC